MSLPIVENEVQLDGKDATIFSEEYPSKHENAAAPLLNRELSRRFWQIYQPDRGSPLFSPLLHQTFKGLPRTYLQRCGLDPYGNGVKIYHRLLRSAGVESRIDLYPGVPHTFWMAYPDLSMTRKWLEDIVAGTRWLLEVHGSVPAVKSKL